VALSDPQPGLVIRYDYLWSHEAARGRDEGKDRPACLVAASDSTARPRFVVILPITHSMPSAGTVAVEIPLRVRQSLGLDDEPCWVIVSEHNIDEWPNPGLEALPGRPGVFSYGFIPPRLFAEIKAKFVQLARQGGNTGSRR
jgi:hypothetical protein